MIAFESERNDSAATETNWQSNFATMLPEIEQRLSCSVLYVSIRRHGRMQSQKESCTPCSPMFDCTSKVERMSQRLDAWLGTARVK